MNIRVTCAFLIVTSLMTTSPALAQNPFDILNKIIKEVDRQNRQKPEPKREPKPKQNIPQSDAQSRQGQPISNLSYNLSNGMETLNNIEREFASRCKKINTITSALPKNEFGRHGCLPTEYKKTVEWAGLWDKIEIHINWLKGIKNQQYKGRCREQYRNTRFEPNNHLIKVCVG